MTELVAMLSTGKGTWSEVVRLISAEQWERVILITNEFGKSKFTHSLPIEFVVINPDAELGQLVDSIRAQLKDKLRGTEIALDLTSGNGKEHMAVLAAVLKLGLGIRLVSLEGNRVVDI